MISLLAKALPAAWPLWAAELIFWSVITVGGAVAFHLYWNRHVAEPYRVEGDVRTEKRLKPTIDRLTAERDEARKDRDDALAANGVLASSVDSLTTKLGEAKASIEQLKVLAERARAQARKALAEIQARAKRDADEIARLAAVANGPPVAEAVSKADEYLSQLATWRRGL